MFRQLSIALLVAAASVSLSAQRHGSFAHGGRRGIGLHHGAHRFAPGILPYSPYFYGDYDPTEPLPLNTSLDNSVQSDVESAPPQFVIVRPAVADDSPRRAKPGPLVIEWQGDRYVRFGGAPETAAGGTSSHPDYAAPSTSQPALPATQPATQKDRAEAPARELPPAVLVYRDGHREEIAGYAIADAVIYVRANYWQSGYWTKHIPLAALDPVATMQANQQRGVNFMLPSAPNVVIASF